MENNYILIKSFLNKKTISDIFNTCSTKKEVYSKVGTRVGKEKKIRKDVFFTINESNIFDKKIFYKIQEIVNDKYNIKLHKKTELYLFYNSVFRF